MSNENNELAADQLVNNSDEFDQLGNGILHHEPYICTFKFDYEYLTLEKSLEFLGVPKHILLEKVLQKQLRTCFLFDGKLLSSAYLEEDSTTDGYVSFNGYITPSSDVQIVNYLREEDKEFVLDKVRPVASFNKESISLCFHKYSYDTSENKAYEELRCINHQIFGENEYKICTDDLLVATIKRNCSECMFIHSELVEVKEKLRAEASKHKQVIVQDEEEELSTQDNFKKNMNTKDYFRIIVPIIIRYIRVQDQVEFYPEKGGETKFKAKVLDYIKSQPDLKPLFKNFKDNWQVVIRDEGHLKKIFEEKLIKKQ